MQPANATSSAFSDSAASCLTRHLRVVVASRARKLTAHAAAHALHVSYSQVPKCERDGQMPHSLTLTSVIFRVSVVTNFRLITMDFIQIVGFRRCVSREWRHLDELARDGQPLQLQGCDLLPSGRQAGVLLADDLLNGRR